MREYKFSLSHILPYSCILYAVHALKLKRKILVKMKQIEGTVMDII